MKSKDDKSLIEVWEMKDEAWKDYKESEYDNYVDYLKNSVKELKVEYDFKYWLDTEKEKQITTEDIFLSNDKR